MSSSGSGLALESVLSKWGRVVEAESHEGSLLQAMAVLHAWLQRSAAGQRKLSTVTSNMQVRGGGAVLKLVRKTSDMSCLVFNCSWRLLALQFFRLICWEQHFELVALFSEESEYAFMHRFGRSCSQYVNCMPGTDVYR